MSKNILDYLCVLRLNEHMPIHTWANREEKSSFWHKSGDSLPQLWRCEFKLIVALTLPHRKVLAEANARFK